MSTACDRVADAATSALPTLASGCPSTALPSTPCSQTGPLTRPSPSLRVRAHDVAAASYADGSPDMDLPSAGTNQKWIDRGVNSGVDVNIGGSATSPVVTNCAFRAAGRFCDADPPRSHAASWRLAGAHRHLLQRRHRPRLLQLVHGQLLHPVHRPATPSWHIPATTPAAATLPCHSPPLPAPAGSACGVLRHGTAST